MYINWKKRQLILTLALYGPPQSGKTTSWQFWSKKALSPPGKKDNTLSLALKETQGKQILIRIRDIRSRPDDASTRRVGLFGVDGLIFVADLNAKQQDANLASFRELELNLDSIKKSIHSLPIIMQYNKSDLPTALTVEQLAPLLKVDERWPYYVTSAINGEGLVTVLKYATDTILLNAMQSFDKTSSFLNSP